jgi:dipeptidase D
MGCAGGVDTTATFRYVPVPVEDGDIALRVRLSGCKGGHSGCDIHLQRANANKLLFRFLKEAVSNYEARLACVQGGSLRNAIPREAEAVITIPADAYDDVMNLVDDYETLFVTEFEGVEDAISLTAEQIDCPKTEMPEEVQDYLIHAITICPHGVYRMMTEMPDIVETSNNLAMIEFSREGEENVIKVQCLTRSAVESRKRELREIIHSAFSIAGADVAFAGDYPGWKPNINSRIMHTMKAIYEREFKTEPRIVIIHAGLECGIIGRNYPGMDMISFGPTIEHPHSPDERVNIATVQKFYDFLLATLKEL